MASNNCVNRAFRLVKTQNFTSTGAFSYTPSSNIDAIRVQSYGAGGGGGGVTAVAAQTAAGGGGACGGAQVFWMSLSQINSALSGGSIAGSIGAGGTAGSTSGGTGGTGGNTTFADWTAAGGLGGVGMTASATSQTALGGAGQANTTGTGSLVGFSNNGIMGQAGFTLTTILAHSGKGMTTTNLGVSGPSIILVAAGSTAGASTGVGSGGSGAASLNNTTARAGGAGGDGAVFIEEYCYA